MLREDSFEIDTENNNAFSVKLVWDDQFYLLLEEDKARWGFDFDNIVILLSRGIFQKIEIRKLLLKNFKSF